LLLGDERGIKITVHPPTIKRLRRFYWKEKNLNFSFETELLGTRIIYDSKKASLTIKDLPEDLIAQLEEVL